MSFESFVNSFSDNIEIKPLSEASDVIDSLHKTPNYSEKGIPMVRVTDIKGGFLKTNNSLKVEETVYKEFTKNHIPQKGDMVMSRVGTYGISSYINGNQKFCLGQNTVVIVPKINSQYLYYCLQSPFVKNQIEYLVVGSTQKTISLKSIRSLKIPICEPELQKLISSVLFTIDYKIEIDNRINKTLEEMAQAIFKSWFVDFEPFRDSEFLDSELGWIPKGWDIDCLYNFADYINGAAFKPNELSLEGIPVIKIAELKNGINSATKFFQGVKDNNYYLRDGDILFSWSGSPSTSIDIFCWNSKEKAILNQHIFRVIPNNDIEKTFIYYLLKLFKKDFIDIAKNKQTTGLGHVTARDLKRLKFVRPSQEVIEQFSKITTPIFNKCRLLVYEAAGLNKIKDILLPRLIPGEIRMPVDIPEKEAD